MIKPLSFEQFIYLGVGDNEAFQQAFKINSEHYTFIEADAEFIDTWQIDPTKHVNLTVLDKAITTEFDTSDEFKRFNLEEFNGFYQNSNLKDLYPGLKPTETMPVESIQFELLFKSIAENANTILWLDIPLQNDNFLKSLLKQDLVKKVNRLKFSWLNLADDSENETLHERLQQLEMVGFVLTDVEQKGDFIEFTLQKSQRAVQLAEEVQMLQGLTQQAQAHSAELETTKQQQTDALKQATADIQVLTEERNHERKRKDDEKAKNENLTQEAQSFQKTIADLQRQITQDQNESDATKIEYVKQIETLKSEREQVRQERDDARKERDGLKTKLEQQDKQVVLLTKQLQATQVQLNDAKIISANLLTENTQTKSQQKQLESQLTKAEAQIDIIKDLLIKPKSHE